MHSGHEGVSLLCVSVSTPSKQVIQFCSMSQMRTDECKDPTLIRKELLSPSLENNANIDVQDEGMVIYSYTLFAPESSIFSR